MIDAAIWSEPYMRNAFLVAIIAAVPSGLIGYFLILRNQVFAGDALSHVAFTGAVGAAAFGRSQGLGLVATTFIVAIVLAVTGRRASSNDVAMGTLFSWLLGLGALFLYLFTTNHSAGNAAIGPTVLFGSVYALDRGDVMRSLAIELPILVAIFAIGRPLLFSSLQATVARTNRVPVLVIDIAFLIIVAAQVAVMVQLLGALLLLGLLVTPAAAASRSSSSPYRAMALAVSLCLVAVTLGLTTSYVYADLPPSFCIITLAFVAYVIAVALSRRTARAL